MKNLYTDIINFESKINADIKSAKIFEVKVISFTLAFVVTMPVFFYGLCKLLG